MVTSNRRRRERAQTAERIRGVYVLCDDLSLSEFRATNISELGLGIESRKITRNLEIGHKIKAKISVGYTTAEVTMKLVHRTKDDAGFEFVDPPTVLTDAIRLIFEPELVGAALKYQEKSTNPLIYQDKNQNEIHLWAKGKTLTRFSISILGNKIERTDAQKYEISLIQNEQTLPLPQMLRSQLISLVQNASTIDTSHRTQLDQILRYLKTE